mmetsp:Transcript_91984/g.291798  ORF Transcript_91984/g.291798 Transcript_91984/m.291798 type:complete len:94 (-) Transcript_91984:92-373(-)
MRSIAAAAPLMALALACCASGHGGTADGGTAGVAPPLEGGYCDCYGFCARGACGMCNQTQAKGCACYCNEGSPCYHTRFWDYCRNATVQPMVV